MSGTSVSEARPFVSVIVPLRNDSDILETFLSELMSTLRSSFEHFEVVVVDDHSDDETISKLTSLLSTHDRIRYIALSRSFGQEVAIAAGLDSVIGDFVVVMLPDSDPPACIPDMIELALEGAETIYGIRRSRESDPLFLRVGACLFYWYCERVLRLDLPKNSTHFRVLSRRVVNALMQIKDRGRYLRTLSQHVGYRSRGFPYDLVQRRSSPRTKSLFEAMKLATDIIVSHSRRPLRMVTWITISLAVVNLLYVVYLVGGYLLGLIQYGGLSPGAVHAGAMFCFLFAVLAVICEYVGGVIETGKGKPLYYVADERSSSSVFSAGTKNVIAELEDR